ncbi:ATP-binding cassette domain-containing protein [Sphingomonas changnyeongensis]|uniref:ATP-binding cassette domain-containing protein n=1 Tax=Sphingomonas changnyeongensis TaxID=2698679 RepID=A0A7Z2S8C7_9SPHN|nr:ABC transporter ATP-binding protein [Sphingomonas changnyeongensis]QHL90507.1 ATP-binding cassette domain-containing protein [Sphingomonas changnyeongensis]
MVEGFDFALRAGSVTALLGPNGAGKSTVAGLITGRLTPDAGRVQLFGRDPRDQLARARMGIMLQSGGLPETLTVAEAITLQAGYYARRLPLADVLEQAGLTALAGRRCDRLSGGEQRRVQFALAIVGSPDLLVLDEPTTGFDPDARRALWQVVRAKADAGAAVLLATHYMDEAEALADRIVVIANGCIIADGPPAAIKAQVASTVLKLRTRLAADRFQPLPGVVRVEQVGADLAILTTRPRAALEAAFALDPALADFEVAGASLEDALTDLVAAARTTKEPA